MAQSEVLVKVLSGVCWQMGHIHNLLWPDCTWEAQSWTQAWCKVRDEWRKLPYNTDGNIKHTKPSRGGRHPALSLIKWWHETDGHQYREESYFCSPLLPFVLFVNSGEYFQAIYHSCDQPSKLIYCRWAEAKNKLKLGPFIN